jgi:hypothetical protein
VGVNAQSNLAASDSIPVRIAGYQRRKMYQVFLSSTGIGPQETLAGWPSNLLLSAKRERGLTRL